MIAILDYKAGNLTSVELALRHVGGECKVTQDPKDVAAAERVVFPGVGSAAACMSNLRQLGLDHALRKAIDSGKPVLAICIGQQLLFERSEEDGGVECLAVFPGEVKRFNFQDKPKVKIPHMGWNLVSPTRPHYLLKDLPKNGECYFVHSYHVCPANPTLTCATTEYGGTVFSSAVARNNLFAAQFHPEKSGEIGLGILLNFLTWNGC